MTKNGLSAFVQLPASYLMQHYRQSKIHQMNTAKQVPKNYGCNRIDSKINCRKDGQKLKDGDTPVGGGSLHSEAMTGDHTVPCKTGFLIID
ncbi:unnamed protein product [Absidia cylindrospora]